jgi:hypothetical protein
MKKIQIALLALMTVFTFSCASDDSSSNNNGNNDDTYINFKIDGTQVNMSEPTTITSLMTSISNSQEAGEDFRSIVLTIPVDASVGSHSITDASPSDLTAYSAHYSMGDVTFDAVTGTMNITSMGEEYMEGTFSFSGEYEGTTYHVTEGTFRSYKPNNN